MARRHDDIPRTARRERRVGRGFAIIILAVGLAACTYRPGSDNPVERSLSWYSYAEATDLRDSCVPGAADRIRLIYNGRYDEQVRTYDINAADDGAVVEIGVRGPSGDLARGVALRDLLGPWRAETRLVRITATEMAKLRRSLVDSGLTRPAPGRLRFNSDEFYWLASACLDGRFVVNGWKYPSPGFAQLGFPAVLLSHDPTGVPLNSPRPTKDSPYANSERSAENVFQFVLDGNRLTTGGALFGG